MTEGDNEQSDGSAAPRSTRRNLVVAALLVLPLLYPVLSGTFNAARVMFGRDQGVFHYVAWAIGRGYRDYLDICDLNGPLVHGVHQLFIALAGTDELRFRALDLFFTGISFALAGACLPGITATASTPRTKAVDRVAWAAVAWVVLSVQYLSYGYWDISQRENFAGWFVLPSLGLQLLAQGNAALSRRSQHLCLGLAGALSVLPWFVKPTYALTSVVQLAAFAVQRPARKAHAGSFAVGMAFGATLELVWIGVFGNIPAFFKTYLWDGPRLYSPIWRVEPLELLARTGFPNLAPYAAAMAVLVAAMAYKRMLAPRALLLAAVPIASMIQILVQGKGFSYHYHPLTASLFFCGLAVLRGVTERPLARTRWLSAEALPPLIACCSVALLGLALTDSPFLNGRSKPYEGRSFERPRPELAEHFKWMRFQPWDIGQAARYLEHATAAHERVFLYATNPYVLLLANRLGATCELYPCQLNIDAALDGRRPNQEFVPGKALDRASAAALRALRDRTETAMLARLEREKPAACVFVDGEPFMSVNDAWLDFATHNARAAEWIRRHYRRVNRIGTVQIWLRSEAFPTATR